MGSIHAVSSTPPPADTATAGRVLARLRALRERHRGLAEITLLGVLYAAYSMTRSFADHTFAAAAASAQSILQLERPLHLDFELTLNRWIMGSEAWSVAASFWYAAAHFLVTGGVLFVLFHRRPRLYPALRNTLVLATVIALVFFYLLPTAPPRLIDGPYQDVLAATADHGWWGAHASAPRGMASMTNELAAFPSMHAGWSLWVAVAAFAASRSRVVRGLGIAYALTTAVCVLVTGNHWTLDVLAGWVVVGAAAAVCHGLRVRTRPTVGAAAPLTSDRVDREAGRSGSVPTPADLVDEPVTAEDQLAAV
ncbi:phosphatase PAP2 family protein [Cellulomonas soli]|uniref:phosphatase PAP2 family protein n=1 Tax=Cellulomonas soli TaxID=931535 RepID=UPI003F848971